MTHLRFFGPAGEKAGTRVVEIPGDTVGELLEVARSRYGDGFAEVLARSRVWVNGKVAGPDTPVHPDDEVAILPPVSGG